MSEHLDLFEKGKRICEHYDKIIEKIIEQKEKSLISSPQFNQLTSLPNPKAREKELLNNIIQDDYAKNKVSVFLEIILNEIPKVYPREGMYLRLKYYERLTTREVRIALNLRYATFYRIRKNAYEQVALI